jgi:hypothetical protein
MNSKSSGSAEAVFLLGWPAEHLLNAVPGLSTQFIPMERGENQIVRAALSG